MDPRAAGAVAVRRWPAGAGWQELAVASSALVAQGAARRVVGYREHHAAPQRWREVPHAAVVLVLSLGEPFRVGVADGAPRPMPGFVAGLHDRFAMVESDGAAECVQVDLAPAAAARLLGLPLVELANRVVPVDEVLGQWSRELTGRLAAARHWETRLALLEAALQRRLASATPVAGDLAAALARLEASGGALAIGALAREIGCSRKHLTTRFRQTLGLPPKTLARVLRFDRLVRHINTATGARWAELAAAAGYYDQAHLARDVCDFTGLAPRAWLAQHHLPYDG